MIDINRFERFSPATVGVPSILTSLAATVGRSGRLEVVVPSALWIYGLGHEEAIIGVLSARTGQNER